MESGQNNNLDFKQIIVIAIPWLVVCAFADLSIYYSQFDRNLLSYFTISDVLPNILPELVLLCIILVVGSIIFTFMIKIMSAAEGEGYLQSFNFHPDDTRYERFMKISVPQFIVTFLVVFVFSFSQGHGNIMIIVSPVAVIAVTQLYLFIKTDLIKDLISQTSHFLTPIFINLFVISSCIGYLRADAVKYNYYKGTSINVNGCKVLSDSTFYYIGKTSSYIIFYNSLKDAATLYPASEVKEINLQLKKPPIDTTHSGLVIPIDPTHPPKGATHPPLP